MNDFEKFEKLAAQGYEQCNNAYGIFSEWAIKRYGESNNVYNDFRKWIREWLSYREWFDSQFNSNEEKVNNPKEENSPYWNTEEIYRHIWAESRPLSNPALINELVRSNNLVFRKRMIPRTPFHIVDRSPWPLCAAVCLNGWGFVFVSWVNDIDFMDLMWVLPLSIGVAYGWCWDIIKESTFQGFHTKNVQRGINMGFWLFVFSEFMLFVSFFWAFCHAKLVISVELWVWWPPRGIHIPSWKGMPGHNTALLITSSFTANVVRKSLKRGYLYRPIAYIGITILLALAFLRNQYNEYLWTPFTISDGIYGSCFFMLTGLHGVHVIAGTVVLIIILGRLGAFHFSTKHHVGLTCSIWYWHFVDIMWVLVYFVLYIWGA